MSLWCYKLLEEAADSVQRHAPELRPVHLRKRVDHVSTPLKRHCLRGATRDCIHRSARTRRPISCIETGKQQFNANLSNYSHSVIALLSGNQRPLKYFNMYLFLRQWRQMKLAGVGAAKIKSHKHAGCQSEKRE